MHSSQPTPNLDTPLPSPMDPTLPSPMDPTLPSPGLDTPLGPPLGMDRDLETRLTELYQDLDERLRARKATPPKMQRGEMQGMEMQRRNPSLGSANPCGTCKACCTSQGRRQHSVTGLELAYLVAQGGSAVRFEAFLDYLAQTRDEGGKVIHEVCPHYQAEAGGCTVYQARPYSCRVFGHWRLESSSLPEACTFEGSEEVFTTSSYLQVVPHARRLVELEVEFRGRGGLAPSPATSDASPIRPEPPPEGAQGEPPATDTSTAWLAGPPPPWGGIERAIYHQARNEREAAHAAFAAASEEHAASAWVWQAWGWLYQEEGRWEEASSCYARAHELEPANPEYPALLALAYLERGHNAEALQAAQASLGLKPDQDRLQLLCAHLCLALQRHRQAVWHFEHALALAPDNLPLLDALERARALAQHHGSLGPD